jgi:hypothetical protein
MKLIALLTALLLPAAAGAKDLPETLLAYAELAAAENSARSLPPCEGMQRLWETAAARATPNTCPNAHEYWEGIEQMHTAFLKGCRDLETLMDDVEPAQWCGTYGAEQRQVALMRSLHDLKIRTQKAAIGPDGEFPDTTLIEKAGDLENQTGEFANPACTVGTNLTFWLRKREMGLLYKHFAYADDALDSPCEKPAALEKYRLYQRGGEAEAEKGAR